MIRKGTITIRVTFGDNLEVSREQDVEGTLVDLAVALGPLADSVRVELLQADRIMAWQDKHAEDE